MKAFYDSFNQADSMRIFQNLPNELHICGSEKIASPRVHSIFFVYK